MRKINKNHESTAAKALQGWRKKHPTKTYNNLADTKEGITLKRKVRAALIAEQYCLCAYCTLRITLKNSHNEHVIPKGGGHAQSNQQLDYANLVAACKKGAGGCRCADTKDAQRIPLTPLEEACETELEFRWNGKVRGTSPEAKKTIEILGLNERSLVSRRRITIETLLMKEELKQWEVEDDEMLQILLREILIEKDNGCLTDFSPVLINILDHLY
jgi:uncharacterized protein (TIGR02646 family)